MQIDWTKGIKDPEEKATLIVSIQSASYVLTLLAEILQSRADADAKSSKDDYLSPGWAYRQADKAGYARALREAIDLTKVN